MGEWVGEGVEEWVGSMCHQSMTLTLPLYSAMNLRITTNGVTYIGGTRTIYINDCTVIKGVTVSHNYVCISVIIIITCISSFNHLLSLSHIHISLRLFKQLTGKGT